MKKTGTFQSSNGREQITYYAYIPDGEVTGVVQLVHGMAEHILRYEEFAEFLNEHGFAVFGHDHMAHGKSILEDLEPGVFKDTNQWSYLVDDTYLLTQVYFATPKCNKMQCKSVTPVLG